MAFSPENHNYAKYDWSGVVTQNDLAIQNQPWSLGQHEGPTEAQRAQQEREQWFRDRGLDPNKYYGEEIEAQAPQPGFNPAGGKVNQSNRKTVSAEEQLKANPNLDPTALAAALASGATANAQAKARNQYEKQHPVQAFDRKAAAALGAARPNAAAGSELTANNWWSAPNSGAVTPGQSPMSTSGPVVPQTPQILDGPQNPLLPNYAKQYQTVGMALQPMAQVGQPTRSVLPQLQQQQQGFATPGSAPIGTPSQSFGNAAKLLQLPSYLRRGMGGIRRY